VLLPEEGDEVAADGGAKYDCKEEWYLHLVGLAWG
jgi:hypothetical protein